MDWLKLRWGKARPASNAGDARATVCRRLTNCVDPPLRALASQRGLRIGAAVDDRALRDDLVYREILAREFNMVTCENAIKFGPLRPSRQTFAFAAADSIVAFAESHGMAVRGHALLWHKMLPEWFRAGGFSYDDAIDVLRGHIQTVTRHYAGRLAAWDVVNEAVENDGSWRQTPFLKIFGPDYLSMAFHWAHEGDPSAKLFYNDYCADEINPKSDAIHEIVRDLLKQGVPIHGVGLQMHVDFSYRPRPDSIARNIRRFVELGLDVHITEMDVALDVPASKRDLDEEARMYREAVEICLATQFVKPRQTVEGCSALVTWGVTDRYSWVPQHFRGKGAPLLFDEKGQPKPAYFAVREALLSGAPSART